MPWEPSSDYQIVSKANREYYALTAQQYDATETCVTDPRAQGSLESDLDKIITLAGLKDKKDVLCLDACGGSGNVALKLIKRGIPVVLCDASPELVRIFQSKVRPCMGAHYQVVIEEIATYLSTAQEKFDLIVFSSALHHLEDYTSVLKLAASRLRPGGMIYTVFDPLVWKFPAWHIIKLEYVFFKLIKHTRDFLPTCVRRLKTIFTKERGTGIQAGKVSLGAMAEYHVDKGIDDLALLRDMTGFGMTVVWHERSASARWVFFEWLLRVFCCQTGFKLLLRAKL